MKLDKKRSEVLKEVVKEYIETGEPVSSEKVAKGVSFPISSATVRNYMAELLDMGYLTQQHVSSGRIPTSKAFRFYVEEALKERKRIRPSNIEIPNLETFGNLREMLSQISDLISQYTNEISLVVSPCIEEDKLRYVHFFIASEFLYTVIVSTLQTTEAIPLLKSNLQMEQVIYLENFLNEKLKNLAILEASKRIVENNFFSDELNKDLAIVAFKFYEKLKEEQYKRKTQEIFIRGISNLLTTQIEIAEERLKFLFNMLEKKETINKLLVELEQDEKLQIVIGDENKIPELWDYSLITVKYTIKELEGTLGLLGPIRMNYVRGILVLEEIADKLEKMAEKLLG